MSVVPLAACNSLPNETCFGQRVNGLGIDAGTPDATCTSCLQDQCCDEVGACQDDPGCRDAFRSAHQCVSVRGPGAESECISPLLGPTTQGRRLYNCMRGRCGGLVAAEAPCGVSNCVPDKAIVLLASPTCDRCLSGSCCKEMNECYTDRRCKLAVECIVTDCKASLGGDMSRLGSLEPKELIEEIRVAVCAGGDLVLDASAAEQSASNPLLAGDQAGGACIQECLFKFAPTLRGTADDANARCLAYNVFACGAALGCGAACTPDGGASDDAGVDAD